MKKEENHKKQIGDAQFEFYRRNRAGCLFAAMAAKDPAKYGWVQKIASAKKEVIVAAIDQAIAAKNTSMLSLVFPTVTSPLRLMRLVEILCSTGRISLEQNVEFRSSRCIGLRAKVADLTSWITGLGPFGFLPNTRQSPFTEVAFRVKPRPKFKWVMKESPEGVIHLADLDMLGLADVTFRAVWRTTIQRTARLLGHEPDLRSAAKTTFAIPIDLWSRTYLSSANDRPRSTLSIGSYARPQESQEM